MSCSSAVSTWKSVVFILSSLLSGQGLNFEVIFPLVLRVLELQIDPWKKWGVVASIVALGTGFKHMGSLLIGLPLAHQEMFSNFSYIYKSLSFTLQVMWNMDYQRGKPQHVKLFVLRKGYILESKKKKERHNNVFPSFFWFLELVIPDSIT